MNYVTTRPCISVRCCSNSKQKQMCLWEMFVRW